MGCARAGRPDPHRQCHGDVEAVHQCRQPPVGAWADVVRCRRALQHHAAGRPLALRATVNNVTNKAYWGMPLLSSLALGAPRTVLLSATMVSELAWTPCRAEPARLRFSGEPSIGSALQNAGPSANGIQAGCEYPVEPSPRSAAFADEPTQARLYTASTLVVGLLGVQTKMAWLVNANAASFSPSITRSPTYCSGTPFWRARSAASRISCTTRSLASAASASANARHRPGSWWRSGQGWPSKPRPARCCAAGPSGCWDRAGCRAPHRHWPGR